MLNREGTELRYGTEATVTVHVTVTMNEYDAAQASRFMEEAMLHFYQAYDKKALVSIAIDDAE